MRCRYCKRTCVKKGVRKNRQRYQCTVCKKYQLKRYTYKLYNSKDDKNIFILNAESTSISGIHRILGYSRQTIMRRIEALGLCVKRPILNEYNQVYEVDEMWTYIGKNKPENYVWITYAINRRTKQVIDVVVGNRTKENLGKVISKLKHLRPKKIVTDRLNTYPKLVYPVTHDTNRYRNNRIERANLTLRQHIKRLNRKTLSYSKSIKMLEATILLYFYWKNWVI